MNTKNENKMETNPTEDLGSNIEDSKSEIVDLNEELKEFQEELVELKTELKDIENQIRENKGGDNGRFKELMAMKSDILKQITEVEMDIEFIETSNQ
jgi:predicted  nucleic acid-binding Zn-ribbon protein